MDQVGDYIARHPDWAESLTKLRQLLKDSELAETIKWGGPCYTLQGRNVIGLAAFRHHLALWFHQGVLLDDPEKVLVNAQEGKTRAQRQWRFTRDDRIPVAKVRRYIRAAIALEKSGERVKPQRGKPIHIPIELAQALGSDRALKKAFEALRPGLQREYAEHVAGAKREQTRHSRLEKVRPMIIDGIGLNDRYRKH